MKVFKKNTYDPKKMPKLVAELVHSGATVKSIAAYLGVSEKTLHTWRGKYPELAAAFTTAQEGRVLKIQNKYMGNLMKSKNPTHQLDYLKAKRPHEWAQQKLTIAGVDGEETHNEVQIIFSHQNKKTDGNKKK